MMGLVCGLGLGLILAGVPASGESLQANTPSARVSGRILEEGTNAPISSARVTILPQGPPRAASSPPFRGGPPPQTTSDENGRYVFDGLAPGRYRIDAQKAGFAPAVDPFTINPSMLRPFELAAGQALNDMNVLLRKGGAIAGQVLGASFGEPLADARVMAMRRPPRGPSGRLLPVGQNGQTNDLGEFRIFGLPPGEYFIVATPPSDDAFAPRSTSITSVASGIAAVTTFYPGTADLSAAQPVTVTAGRTMDGIIIRLATAPVFQVSGVVVDEQGAPVDGAVVMLMGDPRTSMTFAGPGGRARTDANGKFVIGNVASGSYRMTATVPIIFNGQPGATGGGGAVFFASGSPPNPGSGLLGVTISGANVDDLRIVVTRPQRPQ